MRCVIMQPTYMPWAGYLHLIDQADVFVFLDDVQFEKQSWQNRNRVLVRGAPHWLTVPVLRQHLSVQPSVDVSKGICIIRSTACPLFFPCPAPVAFFCDSRQHRWCCRLGCTPNS